MRAFAMTGIVTASWISTIFVGSAIRATPPSLRMSAGTRSRAMTATAPASSAIRACSAVVTSMITPPFSISARPLFTRMVPSSAMPSILHFGLQQEFERGLGLLERRDHVEPARAGPGSLYEGEGDLEADGGRIRVSVGEPALNRFRDHDPGHLVVQAIGEGVAPNRPDAHQQRDRRLPSDRVEEAVEVLEVEKRLRHREVRTVLDLLPEALDLARQVLGGWVDGHPDVE